MGVGVYVLLRPESTKGRPEGYNAQIHEILEAMSDAGLIAASREANEVLHAAQDEWKEHPSFTAAQVVRIAQDHYAEENGPMADADWTVKHSEQALREAKKCARRRDWPCAQSKGREAKHLADTAWHKAPKSFFARKRIEKQAERQFGLANDFLWDVRDARRGTR